jgi:multisubunit Na+/H+ antiporter MnhF subunit
MFELLILIIILALGLAFVRFLIGPKLSNRVVAFDTMSIIAVSLLVVLSLSFKSSLYLDVAFVFALIGFLGVIVFARFNTVESKDA